MTTLEYDVGGVYDAPKPYEAGGNLSERSSSFHGPTGQRGFEPAGAGFFLL